MCLGRNRKLVKPGSPIRRVPISHCAARSRTNNHSHFSGGSLRGGSSHHKGWPHRLPTRLVLPAGSAFLPRTRRGVSFHGHKGRGRRGHARAGKRLDNWGVGGVSLETESRRKPKRALPESSTPNGTGVAEARICARAVLPGFALLPRSTTCVFDETPSQPPKTHPDTARPNDQKGSGRANAGCGHVAGEIEQAKA